MRFRQIIEFRTSRIDDFNAQLDAWMVKTQGHRSRTKPPSAMTATPRTSTC